MSTFGSTSKTIYKSSQNNLATMDPADLDNLHQVIHSQGSLVGRHKHGLQEVMKSFQGLFSIVSQPSKQLNQLTSQLPLSIPSMPASVSNPPTMSSSAQPTSKFNHTSFLHLPYLWFLVSLGSNAKTLTKTGPPSPGACSATLTSPIHTAL